MCGFWEVCTEKKGESKHARCEGWCARKRRAADMEETWADWGGGGEGRGLGLGLGTGPKDRVKSERTGGKRPESPVAAAKHTLTESQRAMERTVRTRREDREGEA